MTLQPTGETRPLCPKHFVVMVTNAGESRKKASDRSEPMNIFLCECPIEHCTQNYSPEMGYFALEKVQDHWFVTGSSSLKLHRNETQVICGDAARNVMFLERIDPKTNEQIFRCPQKDCGKAMKIPAISPPVYWLAEGFLGGRG